MDNNTDFHERIMTILRVAIAIIATVILIMMVGGCSAQWHVQRAVIKDPSILTQSQSVKFDTVIVTQPIYATDTFTLREYDTIVNTVNGIEYKIIRRVDTFEVDIKCPPDTIFINKNIECPPQVKHTPLTWWQKNKWWIFVLAIGTAAFFIMRKYTKLLKK